MAQEVVNLEVLSAVQGTFPLVNSDGWDYNGMGHNVQVNSDSSQPHGGINGRLANWGDRGAPTNARWRRTRWKELLEEANELIAEVWGEFESLSTNVEVQTGIYPYISEMYNNGDYSFERSVIPSGFVNSMTKGEVGDWMHENAGPSARWYDLETVNIRGNLGTLASLTTLYNALYQNFSNTTFLPYERNAVPDWKTRGIDIEILEQVISGVRIEFAQRQVLRGQTIFFEEGGDIFGTGFTRHTLTPGDIGFLKNRPAYKEYFSTTFNKDAITFVPILQNFYLTGKYFSNIDTAFESTKDRALDILITTILNDDNFDALPNLTRPAAAAAIAEATGADQDPAFSSAGRDFLLKMLVKTPIDILKGLVELIDPHVAITKLIKTGTGHAFNELATQMDPPAKQINENLKGEDLLKLVLCIVDQSLDAAEGGMPQPPSGTGEQEFFPRISIDGVDFTGTVSGMFMVPPSPLGLIYLLLELLKNEITDAIENVDEASENAAAEAECEDEG